HVQVDEGATDAAWAPLLHRAARLQREAEPVRRELLQQEHCSGDHHADDADRRCEGVVLPDLAEVLVVDLHGERAVASPISMGVPKSAKARMNTSSEAARRVGTVSRIITCQMRRRPVLPIREAASSSELSTLRKAAFM